MLASAAPWFAQICRPSLYVTPAVFSSSQKHFPSYLIGQKPVQTGLYEYNAEDIGRRLNFQPHSWKRDWKLSHWTFAPNLLFARQCIGEQFWKYEVKRPILSQSKEIALASQITYLPTLLRSSCTILFWASSNACDRRLFFWVWTEKHENASSWGIDVELLAWWRNGPSNRSH